MSAELYILEVTRVTSRVAVSMTGVLFPGLAFVHYGTRQRTLLTLAPTHRAALRYHVLAAGLGGYALDAGAEQLVGPFGPFGRRGFGR